MLRLLTKVHEWESLQTLHRPRGLDVSPLLVITWGADADQGHMAGLTGSLVTELRVSSVSLHCGLSSVSLAVSVSQGAGTAQWEPRPTSPATSRKRFESNPDGSRSLARG